MRADANLRAADTHKEIGQPSTVFRRERALSTEYRGVAQENASPADPTQRAGSLSRLHTLVVPSHIDPPVEPRLQVLPFESLAWENFERLCLRVASEHGDVDH